MKFQQNMKGWRQRGFTIIELMVVITIAAILIAVATPSMVNFLADWRVKDAANSMIGQLRLARIEAIRQSRPVALCPVATAGSTTCSTTVTDWKNGWLMFLDNNNDGIYNTANGDVLIKQQPALPGLAQMQKNQPKGLVFLPTGLMKLSGSTSTFNIQSSFQLSGSSASVSCAYISSVGRVRMVALPSGSTICP